MSALEWALAWARRHRVALLRASPMVVVAVALLVLVARNADVPAMPDYEVPEGFQAAPPPTTRPPGAALPQLAAVGGTTTTTVPPNTGLARVTGVVRGPEGPVPGATVRLERFILDETQVVEVTTGGDGRYHVSGIGGGRYRIRAFLPPRLAQPSGEVIFLGVFEERTVDLSVEAFGEPRLSLAYAPDPPMLDQAVNVAVRVTSRQVDGDGVVRTSPVSGASVSIVATGGMTATSSTSDVTDGSGQAVVTFQCRSTTATRLHVTARLPGAAPPTTAAPDPTASTVPPAAPAAPTVAMSYDVPACVDPTTLTTTTTSTVPGASTSSTSSTTSTTLQDVGD